MRYRGDTGTVLHMPEGTVNYRDTLRDIAAYDHGIVTIANAEAVDVPAVEVRKLAQRGALERIGHGVYRFRHGFPRTRGTAEAEAVAIAGPGSLLEGESVLALTDLGHANPAHIEVALTTQRRRQLPSWIAATRRTTLKPADGTHYHGVPSVTVRVALAQVRERLPRQRWLEALEKARRLDLVSAEEERELRTNGR